MDNAGPILRVTRRHLPIRLSKQLDPQDLKANRLQLPKLMKKIVIIVLSLLVFVTLAISLRPRISVAQTGGEPSNLISQVTVTPPGNQPTRVLESSDDRINLAPSETISLDVQLSPGTGIVRLRAPNGGSINNQGGKLDIDTDNDGRELALTFDPGPMRGRYTVEISDGQRTEILRFWVGPPPPLGRPGPPLTFNEN